MPIKHEERVSYLGIELRCFECNDVWIGPCQLLGAMLADDHVAEHWERGAFDSLTMDQAEDAQRLAFESHRRRIVSMSHRLVWDLNVEHHESRKTH
jgi:hypothetical protein